MQAFFGGKQICMHFGAKFDFLTTKMRARFLLKTSTKKNSFTLIVRMPFPYISPGKFQKPLLNGINVYKKFKNILHHSLVHSKSWNSWYLISCDYILKLPTHLVSLKLPISNCKFSTTSKDDWFSTIDVITHLKKLWWNFRRINDL